MEVSLVENMPSVSLCKKLLNHLHFICLARGLDVTRPVIITNALTSINNHIIIEHNNYYLSFLQDMFPYFEKYGLINVLPDIISRIELLMNEKESTINELDKALLLDYKVWLLLSKKELQVDITLCSTPILNKNPSCSFNIFFILNSCIFVSGTEKAISLS